MRKVDTSLIYGELKKLIADVCVHTTDSCKAALRAAAARETNERAAFALDVIEKNIGVAAATGRPLCQDTGMAVVFLEIGQEVLLTGDLLSGQVDRAVADAYREGNFRMSVLDPLTRKNTGDNTPAVLHTEIVAGDGVNVAFLPKGFGSENMTKTYMLTPAEGTEGVVAAVLDAVKRAGSSPCPPVVVGVGVGGTLDKAALLAKKALLREVGAPSPDADAALLERRLLAEINALGIGVQGFGGCNTALGVAVETFPTHIAGLPVCVSLQCHSVRVGRVRL